MRDIGRRVRVFGLALLAGLAFAAAPGVSGAAVTVYKWTDDRGVVHYSDTPPPDTEYEKLKLEATGTRPAPGQRPPEEQESEGGTAPDATDVNITQAEIRVEKLEQRVDQARKVYEQARKNRVEGEKVRLGSEQNYVRYLERVEKLKQQEESAREKLEELRRKLEEARTRLERLREKEAAQAEGR